MFSICFQTFGDVEPTVDGLTENSRLRDLYEKIEEQGHGNFEIYFKGKPLQRNGEKLEKIGINEETCPFIVEDDTLEDVQDKLLYKFFHHAGLNFIDFEYMVEEVIHLGKRMKDSQLWTAKSAINELKRLSKYPGAVQHILKHGRRPNFIVGWAVERRIRYEPTNDVNPLRHAVFKVGTTGFRVLEFVYDWDNYSRMYELYELLRDLGYKNEKIIYRNEEGSTVHAPSSMEISELPDSHIILSSDVNPNANLETSIELENFKWRVREEVKIEAGLEADYKVHLQDRLGSLTEEAHERYDLAIEEFRKRKHFFESML